MFAKFCPFCGKETVSSTRPAYIEIGEWDEHADKWEEEYGVSEYVCSECNCRFFA
ncbi:hypothetical protein ALO_12501 [Acetonema longum DSM 6540]|uniref:Uncharacterized protein n=1 Tax=Acetonema longum DSM 6540 TaxID=1009370 RepID=F7NK87_9FIRM|nr:hypothetical protein ALO_12501 [Acetonema longum DSM 6540]